MHLPLPSCAKRRSTRWELRPAKWQRKRRLWRNGSTLRSSSTCNEAPELFFFLVRVGYMGHIWTMCGSCVDHYCMVRFFFWSPGSRMETITTMDHWTPENDFHMANPAIKQCGEHGQLSLQVPVAKDRPCWRWLSQHRPRIPLSILGKLHLF